MRVEGQEENVKQCLVIVKVGPRSEHYSQEHCVLITAVQAE